MAIDSPVQEPSAAEMTATDQAAVDTLLANAQPEVVDMRSLGSSGLIQYGGYVYEEILRQLQGREACRVYKEMLMNDAACGTIVWFVNAMVRGVNWYVKAASPAQNDNDNAEFVDSCLHDMDQPFDSCIDEHMSMVPFGFAPCEILFKRRLGQAPEAFLRSRYTDGRIGLRGLPLRAQETIMQWEFDDAGGVTALYQQAPPNNRFVRIPMDKIALFRTSNFKGNPEGVSAFRRCFRAYYNKVRLQNIEAIGIERDLAGFPVMTLPYRMMSSMATPAERDQYAKWTKMITRIKRGEQEGAVLPYQPHPDTKENQFQLKLLSSGGARQHNISEVINRYDDEIFRSLMADFMKLGASATSAGSWALHSDKTQMFLQAITVYLSQIKEVYNQTIIPKLIRMNGLPASDYPTLEHTPLEKVDAKEMADTLLALAQSGCQVWPDDEVKQRMYDLMGINTPIDPERQTRIRETMPVTTRDPTQSQVEVPAGADPSFQADQTELTGDEAKDRNATGIDLRNVKVT